MNKVIRLKIRPQFPVPSTKAEHGALFHMVSMEMTLAESDVFVRRVTDQVKQERRERKLVKEILVRLEAKWNSELQRQYFEWREWYSTHGN